MTVAWLPWEDRSDPVYGLAEHLVAPPRWMEDAACRDQPLELFFATAGYKVRLARRVCARCPVLHECRAWALRQGPDLYGTWGGLRRTERLEMLGVRPSTVKVTVRGRAPAHGTKARYSSPRWACRCALCRQAVADYYRERYRLRKAAAGGGEVRAYRRRAS